MEPDDMVDGYIECALWAGLDWSDMEDNNPRPLDDKYSRDDLAGETIQAIHADCATFVERAGKLLDDWPMPTDYVGHDLHLTRNGHGTGFWDRYSFRRSDERHLAAIGDKLADIARNMGERELYVGDDGKLYIQ